MIFGDWDWDMCLKVRTQEAKDEGIEIGEARGEARGKEEKAIEAARNLIKLNLLSLEQIAQAQGLPIEKVQKLAEELKQSVIS